VTGNLLMQRASVAHRFRWVDRIAIMAIVVWLFGVYTAPSAFAAGAVDQGGRYDSSFSSTANKLSSTAATMISASPSSGSCIVISVIHAGGSNQVETGLTRCNGTSIDGTCASGQTFVETSEGSGFTCYPHGSFALGSYYSIGVARPATNEQVGQIAGTLHEGIPGGWPSTIYARTWGEWTTGTGSHTCSGWSAVGQFTGWTYTTNSGTIVNFTNSNTSVAAGCWSVGSLSGADYVVSH